MPTSIASIEIEQRKRLFMSAFISALIYLVSFAAALIYNNTRSATPVAKLDAPTVEAELVENIPTQPKLYESPQSPAAPSSPDDSVSRDLDKSNSTDDKFKAVVDQSNKTVKESPPLYVSHGAMVDFAPVPVLPSYLKDRNLKTSILIEFTVTITGASTPTLLGTSGNDELDALALKTAGSWRFRPAIREGSPIDSKVRLRINFQVE